jgi:thiol-disulfide isomerase/thioredoxin
LTGLAAITIVVAGWFASIRVALDFRAMFALTGTAFLFAGFARGEAEWEAPGELSLWHIARVAAPALLGAVALVMIDRYHRPGVPIGVFAVALITATAGLYARRYWDTEPRVSAVIAGAALTAVVVVPALSAVDSFRPSVRDVDPFVLSSGYRTIPSTALQGRVVVLAFWASWCGPCHEELPELERVYRRYSGDERVAIYAVDEGWSGETETNGENWLRENRLDLPPAFDTGKIAREFNIDAIPTLVLIDTKGRERLEHRGYSESEDLEAGLSKHLDELLEEGR